MVKDFAWLIRLRFCAVAGQAITIGVVDKGMGIPLPLGALATIIALEIAVNLACAWRLRQKRPAGTMTGLRANKRSLDWDRRRCR